MFALLWFAAVVTAHTCVHDTLLADNNHLWHQRHAPKNAANNEPEHGRQLQPQSAWAPIRISPIYQNLLGDPLMTPALAAYVQNTLVPVAINRWAALLTVQPESSLYFPQPCDSYWETGSPWPCASLASASCAISDGVAINVSAAWLATETVYPSSPSSPVTIPGGPGLPGADFGLIVTAVQTSYCGSGGEGTLAYGYTCARDPRTDRPVFGRINFCVSALSAAAYDWGTQIGVATHEIGHALGYSATSWPLFRSATGVPLTPRDPAVPSNPSAAYAVSINCGGMTSTVFAASNSTVQYFAERGMAACNPTAVSPATTTDCVAKLITPSAVAAAQWYLGCPTLNGAELENQLTSACSTVGSHWEQRIFSTELMASYAQHAMTLTPLTAAALEDSGWYRATFSGTDWFRPGASYGFQQGCAFATGKCLLTQQGAATTGQGAPPHFYSSSRASSTNNPVCTTDNLAIGFASVVTYTGGTLPSQYQYFSSAAEGGAPPDVFDYCPAVQAYSDTHCARAADADVNAGYYGEAYGLSSACLASTLIWPGLSASTGPGAACFAVSCPGDGSVQVAVSAGSGQAAGATVTCAAGSAGQSRAVPGYVGALACPDPAVLCGPALQYAGSGAATSTPAPWPFLPVLPSAGASASESDSTTPSATASATATLSTGASPSHTPSPSATGSGTASATGSRASATPRASASPSPSRAPTRETAATATGGVAVVVLVPLDVGLSGAGSLAAAGPLLAAAAAAAGPVISALQQQLRLLLAAAAADVAAASAAPLAALAALEGAPSAPTWCAPAAVVDTRSGALAAAFNWDGTVAAANASSSHRRQQRRLLGVGEATGDGSEELLTRALQSAAGCSAVSVGALGAADVQARATATAFADDASGSGSGGGGAAAAGLRVLFALQVPPQTACAAAPSAADVVAAIAAAATADTAVAAGGGSAGGVIAAAAGAVTAAMVGPWAGLAVTPAVSLNAAAMAAANAAVVGPPAAAPATADLSLGLVAGVALGATAAMAAAVTTIMYTRRLRRGADGNSGGILVAARDNKAATTAAASARGDLGAEGSAAALGFSTTNPASAPGAGSNAAALTQQQQQQAPLAAAAPQHTQASAALRPSRSVLRLGLGAEPDMELAPLSGSAAAALAGAAAGRRVFAPGVAAAGRRVSSGPPPVVLV